MRTLTGSPVDRHVGNRIRARRLALGISQTALGEAADLSFQQIQKYETGTNRVAGETFVLIANALQVRPGFFFEDAPGIKNGTHDRHIDLALETMITPHGVTIATALAQMEPRMLAAFASVAKTFLALQASPHTHQQAAE